MSKQFDHVSIIKKANVYFDGKCVSHNVIFPDGTKKTLGVMLPSVPMTFNTESPQIIEIIEGSCRVRIAGESAWKKYEGGQHFHVSAASSFDLEPMAATHYVCHFVRD